MDGVYLAVVTLAALTCFEALLPLPGAALYLERDLQAAGRLFELVDSEPVVREPAQPCELSDDLELEVQDLYFRYPLEGSPGATHPWTLAGIDFTLRRGQRLAVVGPSGAGKSTLVNLLLRFWDYEEGRILIAGRDFRACQGDQIRERMAIVSQNTFLFNASVHDNLRLARPSASQSELVWAAQQARLHDVLEDLPEGYDTWIGEGGAALSGGERQRLAVARALLRDSPLLILDEPTANLDALTERAVMETLQRLMVGRTTLLITHRLIGMGSMDEILVLDGGRVVERGGHADLLAAGGLYRRLWDFQNQWLVE
jgi:ABC-type multidrug transport system fused ATPase/permease subunit